MTTPGEQPRPRHLVLEDFLDNFPLPEIRPKQREVLQEICERRIEAKEYLDNLNWKRKAISENPNNWVVTEIAIQKHKINFKPLDVSAFCQSLLHKCERTLMMSATILDVDTFCRYIGLPREQVKFIQADSDFPVEHRPIHALNIQ